VLAIYEGGKKRALAKKETAFSNHNYSFEYKVGEIVKPVEKFNEDWSNECASGIHFYITRLEAENHV
jgi:hypothetical protein